MKKQVSLFLMAFMGVCLVLGGCGRSTSGTSVTETQTKAQAGTIAWCCDLIHLRLMVSVSLPLRD